MKKMFLSLLLVALSTTAQAADLSSKTNCFVLKKHNILLNKLDFQSEFCVIDNQTFNAKLVKTKNYVTGINNSKVEKDFSFENKDVSSIDDLFSINASLKTVEKNQKMLELSFTSKEVSNVEKLGKLDLLELYNIEYSNIVLINKKEIKTIMETKEFLFTLEVL